MPRIPIEISYMQVAYQFAQLSYATRRRVGCIIVKDNQVISFGYNGTPHGFENECEKPSGPSSCDIIDCECDNSCEGKLVTRPEVLHAESNAITKVAKSTMTSEHAELYTTTMPCFDCAKLIIQSGISTVYYCEEYRDSSGVELLKRAGIIVNQVNVWNEY